MHRNISKYFVRLVSPYDRFVIIEIFVENLSLFMQFGSKRSIDFSIHMCVNVYIYVCMCKAIAWILNVSI